MVPSGPPAPIGGPQPTTPSLMRSNSEMLRGQAGSQGGFPSLVSPRTQFNNATLLGAVPNMSSMVNHSFGNGNVSPGIHCGLNGRAESDPFSGMGFNSQSSFTAANMANSSISGQGQSQGQGQGQQFPSTSGNHMLPEQSQSQKPNPQNVQQQHPQQQSMQQFSGNQQTQQQPYQPIRGGLGGGMSVKLESQGTGEQHGVPQQQLQSMRGLGQVKLEQQQLQVKLEQQQQMQNMRGVGPVKMEPQHSDQSLFLLQQQQQQQQQQLLQQMSMSRHPQAGSAAQLLQQQRILQLQQQQQQHHLMKSMPQQRPQTQHQFSPQNIALRSPIKSVYEPGMCARRLTHYMYQQQHRPEDNSIEFWRKFVAEYFAPNAKKKWCVSMYGSVRQTTGVFPQDVWHCEICKRKPGRGFEATVEVLPRLFKIKYESGTLEELLYVDMPREYQNPAGQIVLDYAKAIQESVFEQLRVVRDGQLRIVFSPELKICSWEFCARRHEELIPRRLLIPQVSQLGSAAQKYQASTQNSTASTPVSEIQSNCNMFVASARQLAKTLEVPLVNDLGYTKRYVRCLQISEVVNSMKDLIDYSRSTGEGPMESLAKFPRRTNMSSTHQSQNQHTEHQQQQQQQQAQQPLQQAIAQNSNTNDEGSSRGGQMQVPLSNGVSSVNNSFNGSSSTPRSTIAGLLHQNSMNSRHQNPMSNSNSPYGGGSSSVQMPSPGSSSSMPPAQSNTPHGTLAGSTTNHAHPANSPAVSNLQQPAMSGDGDTNDTQSSVQKFIQDIMNNNNNNNIDNHNNISNNNSNNNYNQLNGGGLIGTSSFGNDTRNVNGILQPGNSGLNMPNGIVGNGPMTSNGIRSTMDGRVGMTSMARDQSMNHHQQHDLGNQMLDGFNGLQFDWKASP